MGTNRRVWCWVLAPLTVLGCAAPAPARAPTAGAPTHAPGRGAIAEPLVQREPPDTRGWSCENGKLRGPAAVAGLVIAPDEQSAVQAAELSTAGSAVLVTCRGGLRAVALLRDDFIDPEVDRSQIEPGLNQMGWYRFTPDGARLVFAVTAHARRPNPQPPPAYDVKTLVSKFVVVDIDARRFTPIDTKAVGFNSHDPSNEYIVFWGADASYRADFAGTIVRLTPSGATTYMGPQRSPDGSWVAEALRDNSYLLTSLRDPATRYTLAPPGKQTMIWPFNVFSPRSSLLAYATITNESDQARDFAIHAWSMQAKRRSSVATIQGAYTVLMSVSPDDRYLLLYSLWMKPERTTRVYCVDLGAGRVTVAPQHGAEGNLYVNDDFTVAEIGRARGQGTRVEIACSKWQPVSGTSIGPPGAPLLIPR